MSVDQKTLDVYDKCISEYEKLISKEFAYEKEKHVLFNVKKFNQYGKLSGRNIEDMIAGSRVEVAPFKENEHDFVWFESSKNA